MLTNPHCAPESVARFIPEQRSSRLSVRVPGCQKITNDGLTRSGTGCFIDVPIW